MRNQSGHTLVELGIAAFLLVMLALLCTNVYVLYLGKTYNDKICRDSCSLAAQAAVDGKNTLSVQKAARMGMDSCGAGGVFISHPQFTKFQDDITTEVRVIKLQTQTLVRLPIPFMVVGLNPQMNNKVVFTSNYEYQIKNPKKAESDDDDETKSSEKH